MQFRLIVTANAPGCPANIDSLTYFVVPDKNPELFIPEVITPGVQDGLNDTWEIWIPDGLASKYKDWQLIVYNQSGGRVWTMSPLTTGWSAEGLVGGQYYYELRDPDQNVIESGGFSIIK